MHRRQFQQISAALAAAMAWPSGGRTQGAAGLSTGAAAVLPPLPSIGTNLSGMEWARPGLRRSASSLPNLHFTVPRRAEVAYLASQGFLKNRLPIQWELLQPMLFDTPANAVARAAIGQPGAFHAGYAGYITAVLDAHAAVGAKCVIDLHNYGRYRDFCYQSDGSVPGLTVPSDPLLRPYTTDAAQLQERIIALAPGATLTVSHFVDFWLRAARTWRGHPGLGGYGLMNEPHDLPPPGGTVGTTQGEDLSIWPRFAQAAIRAIRQLDAVTPIYVSGNSWNSAMSLATRNPGYPLQGTNLVYEVHLYLDAYSNGQSFDYDAELAKNFSAGFGVGRIQPDTGADRLRLATAWAGSRGLKLALTEIGMPVDDPRWQEMFERTLLHARQAGVEVFSWMGGSHWPIRNHAINHVPGWHQDKTLEPLVAGPMKAAAGIGRAALFDAGPGHASPGETLELTVSVRGHLAQPLRLMVTASGGSLSRSELLLPAGPNGQARFAFTPPEGMSTLTYSTLALGVVPPPVRRIACFADPLSHAEVNLEEAALALLSRLRASFWPMAQAHTDYLQGRPAREGEPVRAVADAGFGSEPDNAMDMLNWINRDTPASGRMLPPVLRTLGGRRAIDLSLPGTWGLWCKKSAPLAGVQPRPRNRAPFDLEDAHFVVAAIAPPVVPASGVVFQASQAEARHASEIRLVRGQPQLRFVDARGQVLQLTGTQRLSPRLPVVISLTSAPGAQRLRVAGEVVASGSATFAPSVFSQMLIGWGFLDHSPVEGFGGLVFAVVAGRGTPSSAELALIERHLAQLAGVPA